MPKNRSWATPARIGRIDLSITVQIQQSPPSPAPVKLGNGHVASLLRHSRHQPLWTQYAKITDDFIGHGEITGVSPRRGVSLVCLGLQRPTLVSSYLFHAFELVERFREFLHFLLTFFVFLLLLFMIFVPLINYLLDIIYIFFYWIKSCGNKRLVI